jgi:thiazole tautomerase (transcriptional regulator TenI)
VSEQIPRLHLISNRARCPLDRFPAVARQAVDGGVDAVHLREKDLPGRELVKAARLLRQAIGDDALIFINERLDVALITGADGLQLGGEGLNPLDVRAICGDTLLIGRSVHDRGGAERATMERADFIIAGHVYPTPSKPDQPGRSPAIISQFARASDLPVIAIGGITPMRVPEVVQSGAHGIAVISGILTAPDPAIAARAYRTALEKTGAQIDASQTQRQAR